MMGPVGAVDVAFAVRFGWFIWLGVGAGIVGGAEGGEVGDGGGGLVAGTVW